jgi:glycyl-tRNA synthetase
MAKDLMKEIASLCGRRGFIYQSSEIYGGLASCWDYGPLGVELKNNIKEAWWRDVVRVRDDVVGVDTSILMHPDVWVASGHVAEFHDMLVDCLQCKGRFKAEHVEDGKCPVCGGKEFTEPQKFHLMFKTRAGASEATAVDVYLRPETAQGIFADFKLIQKTSRLKVPFGIAQIGKSFRNEVTTKSFIFRLREFEQMELEYFVKPGTDREWFEFWVDARFQWYKDLGIQPENLRLRPHEKKELAHYALSCTDVEYDFPFGWGELEGIANRTDFDLKSHIDHSSKDLSYFDDESKEKYIPYVIEASGGIDRTFLVVLLDAYREEEVEGEARIVLGLDKKIAPIKVAVFPLQRDDMLVEIAKGIYNDLHAFMSCFYDQSGNIGRRYRRQDEIGTPYAITVDFETLDDDSVTIRDRDTMEQQRVKIKELKSRFLEEFA